MMSDDSSNTLVPPPQVPDFSCRNCGHSLRDQPSTSACPVCGQLVLTDTELSRLKKLRLSSRYILISLIGMATGLIVVCVTAPVYLSTVQLGSVGFGSSGSGGDYQLLYAAIAGAIVFLVAFVSLHVSLMMLTMTELPARSTTIENWRLWLSRLVIVSAIMNVVMLPGSCLMPIGLSGLAILSPLVFSAVLYVLMSLMAEHVSDFNSAQSNALRAQLKFLRAVATAPLILMAVVAAIASIALTGSQRESSMQLRLVFNLVAIATAGGLLFRMVWKFLQVINAQLLGLKQEVPNV
jgi:hypothetical protein